ncbi:hypothetical protein MAIC_03870 [Mycolicibacterium aichiense]|uniref:Uncharacterized protein n=1 Tax=Mycolicibacterium aichiense TaxID=1799 RepID=A0AAD1MAQ1_9MYCO|nr:hypothetical protein MAIC_03870 [Mycolicibacterium aichiense]
MGIPGGRSRAVGSPGVGSRAGDIRAARSRAGDIRAARSRAGDIPVARSRAAGSPAADIRAAGRAVDQAIPVAVLEVRQAVPSPATVPDVVAHQPILSSGEVFLNVLAVPGA